MTANILILLGVSIFIWTTWISYTSTPSAIKTKDPLDYRLSDEQDIGLGFTGKQADDKKKSRTQVDLAYVTAQVPINSGATQNDSPCKNRRIIYDTRDSQGVNLKNWLRNQFGVDIKSVIFKLQNNPERLIRGFYFNSMTERHWTNRNHGLTTSHRISDIRNGIYIKSNLPRSGDNIYFTSGSQTLVWTQHAVGGITHLFIVDDQQQVDPFSVRRPLILLNLTQ